MALVDHFKDVNVKDKNGMTPLHYAVMIENEEIIQALVERNANPDIEDQDGETPYEGATKKIKAMLKPNGNSEEKEQ